jgi:hypothetical protein
LIQGFFKKCAVGIVGRCFSRNNVKQEYRMDMPDGTLVMVMTKGIGANLANDEKKAHLIDLKREHLIEQLRVQEILPPEVPESGLGG